MRCLFVCALCMVIAFAGCAPYTYFNTSNDLRQQSSTVHLVDGSVLQGALTVQLETGRVSDRIIQINMGDSIRKLPIGNIAFYKYGPDYYFPKEIDFDVYTINNRAQQNFTDQRNLLFVKRLTPDNAKLNLYELHQSRTQSADGKDHVYYFVSLPGEDRLKAWSFGSSRFFPFFEVKMSEIVRDCPELSKKVAQKEKGYTINQISIEVKRLEIFKRIIDEYNQCL